MKRLSAKDLRDSIRAARPAHDAAAERRLLAAARRGDRAALEAVTRRLSGALHRFGRGFCRDPHDAEDVMQDVLVALIESLSRFRGESSLSSWAYVVARNACARRRKRGARVRPLAPDDAPDALPLHDRGPGPDVVAERRQLRADLESAIAALPGALRDVLVLRDVEGLSAAQVGRRLGLGERAVKSRLHRARVALRQVLSPHAPAATTPGPHCPDVARALSRFLEGELDASACRRLEGHVASCPDCGDVCAELRRALGACSAWREAPAPDAVRRATRAALREALHTAPTASPRRGARP